MLETLSIEEIINRISERFNNGEGPAKNAKGQCVYLNSAGKKCVAGIFLPDGHPSQNAEGSIRGLLRNYDDLRKLFGIIDYDAFMVSSFRTTEDDSPRCDVDSWTRLQLLKWAQNLHDRNNSWGEDGCFTDEAWTKWASMVEVLYDFQPERPDKPLSPTAGVGAN